MALDGTDHGLVLRPGVRASIREYRPAVWLVLQDIALEADWRDDRLVASTSARLVAEHLHLDPGTVAAALRVLRESGLVELTQLSGPHGRFGLAAYTVRLPAGLDTLSPKDGAPRTELPCREEPRVASPHTVGAGPGLVLACPWDGGREPTHDRGSPSEAATGGSRASGADGSPRAPSKRPRRSAAKRPEQGAFDLWMDA
jgi:hypothetical protein